jgi:hypothetical protein
LSIEVRQNFAVLQKKLRLRVSGVMAINPFRQKPLASTLTASRECGATAFGPHAGAKTVLAFPCPLRWLIGAFHKSEKYLRRELRAVTLGWSRGMSISGNARCDLRIAGCKGARFLE